MKAKYILGALLATLLCFSTHAQPRIAVLDFNAGAGISQSDVSGLSAIFNTFFSPNGYTLVERTRVSRVLEEQRIQVSSLTADQRVQIGEILNVSVIVIGDVNLALGQYNVDVRAVNAETGEILAKDGTIMAQGSDYRETMKELAERMSQKIPIVELKRISPYRQTGGYLRFLAGYSDVCGSVAYNYFFTPSIMIGGGMGFGFSIAETLETYHDNYSNWTHTDHIKPEPALPIFLEADIRTPRYMLSFFINAKIGIYLFTPGKRSWTRGNSDYEESFKTIFASFSLGVSYKNLNLGAGLTTNGFEVDKHVAPLVFFISYNIPISSLSSSLF